MSGPLPLPTVASALLCLPSFSYPNTIEKLTRMVADPDCSPALVAGVVSSDPMIAALVLSRANAASPPGEPPVTQLSAACLVLGLSMVHGVLTELQPIPEAQRRTLAAVWGQANACATMCRTLGGLCWNLPGNEDVETLHLAGLLHDLGGLVARLRFPGECAEAGRMVAKEDLTFAKALRATLGLPPNGLGALLARSWGLPPALATVMRHHAKPEKAEEFRELAALVHVSRALVRGCGFTTDDDPFVDPVAPETLDLLGLKPPDLETSLRLFYDEMEEMEMFEGVLAREGMANLSGAHRALT